MRIRRELTNERRALPGLVDLHVGHGDVGGDGEEGQPQVLYVGFPECLLYQGVEAKPGHHGGVGPGEVQHHPPLLAHLETEVPGLTNKRRVLSGLTNERRVLP